MLRQAESGWKSLSASGFQNSRKPPLAAAADAHQRAVGEPAQPPDDTAGDAFGDLLLFELLRFPIEQQHERLVHGAERIRAFVQSAGGQPFAVGADRQRADAAESTCWPPS